MLHGMCMVQGGESLPKRGGSLPVKRKGSRMQAKAGVGGGGLKEVGELLALIL